MHLSYAHFFTSRLRGEFFEVVAETSTSSTDAWQLLQFDMSPLQGRHFWGGLLATQIFSLECGHLRDPMSCDAL